MEETIRNGLRTDFVPRKEFMLMLKEGLQIMRCHIIIFMDQTVLFCSVLLKSIFLGCVKTFLSNSSFSILGIQSFHRDIDFRILLFKVKIFWSSLIFFLLGPSWYSLQHQKFHFCIFSFASLCFL
jgi:hypothetical protein